MHSGQPRRGLDTVPVSIQIEKGDILAYGAGEQNIVLQDASDLATKIHRIGFV